MGVRGVIDHEVDDDADAALLAAVRELNEIAQRAIFRVDAIIVGYVVAVVAAGRWLKRHQPDRRNAEPVQIIETPRQAFEVADAIAIGIHVGPDRQTIKNAVLVPEVVDHPWQPSAIRLRSSSGSPLSSKRGVGSPSS